MRRRDFESRAEQVRGLAREALRAALADVPGSAVSFGAEAAVSGVWGGQGRRTIPLGEGGILHIAHDGWGAPYVVDDDGLLVGLTDERGLEACAWVRPEAGSRIVGLGVDLVCIDDVSGERGRWIVPLILSEHEIGLAQGGLRDTPEEGYAFAFAAKEAAFKACSAPLRAWRGPRPDGAMYEVREFELADRGHVRGTLRKARAQQAMDAMGIAEVRVAGASHGNALVTVALALAT